MRKFVFYQAQVCHLQRFCILYNNNNNPIYKAPKALASEALAAGQSWVLIAD